MNLFKIVTKYTAAKLFYKTKKPDIDALFLISKV